MALRLGSIVKKVELEEKLYHAIIKDDEDKIKECIANGVDVNKVYERTTPLLLALDLRETRIVEILLKAGADPNKNYGNLYPAIESSSRHIKVLLEYGVDLNIKDRERKKPAFFKFLNFMDAEDIPFFIKHGVDINLATDEGITFLHFASRFGMDDHIKVLVENGANINAYDREGKTALMIAILHKKVKTAHLLLDLGADALLKSRYFLNAFMYAAIIGDKGLLERLMQTTNPNLRDNFRKTAFEHAKSKGKLVEFLEVAEKHLDKFENPEEIARWKIRSVL